MDTALLILPAVANLLAIFPSGGTTPEVQSDFKGGSVRYAPVRYAPVRHAPVRWYKPPEGSPEGVPFSEAQSSRAKPARPSRRSEARLHRAKRGSTERSEAPRRLRRAKRGRAKVIGRSPLQKNSKRFHQKAQGNHLFFFFYYVNKF